MISDKSCHFSKSLSIIGHLASVMQFSRGEQRYLHNPYFMKMDNQEGTHKDKKCSK